jgi:hypothetical protein
VKRFFAFATLVVLVFAAVGSVWAENDPRIGTWKLNVAKSKATPGPLPASETRTYEAQGSDIMVAADINDAKGNHRTTNTNVTADGKDRPAGPANGGTTISVKLLGPGSYAGTSKKDGKVTSTNRAVISDGGKVFTFTTKGTNAEGQAFTSVLVYDKQ